MSAKQSLSRFVLINTCLLIVLQSCSKVEDFPEEDYNEWLSGGQQTVFIQGNSAFSAAFPILNARNSRVHEIGDIHFESTFVSGNDPFHRGLGPAYNNVSCVSCHIGDGRGKAPETGESLASLLIRISVPGNGEHGEPLGVPGFGGQFQQRAIFGVPAEGDVDVRYETIQGSFPDGETYELRKPIYTLTNTYQAIPVNVLTSPRLASPVFGLGLLEAIPEEHILASSDESDRNGDGISGKANRVWEVEKNGFSLGRFGWKAGQPSIKQQSAGAYVEDMGITNSIFSMESVYGQIQADGMMDEPEINDSILTAVAFYIQTLAVPARRNLTDPLVEAGKNIFKNIGCGTCHTPMQRTAVNVAFPELSNQIIFPYTDLLLHDLGEELSDYRPEYEANGNEWRTPPLWGIGLTQVVNGHSNFLHDGRARDFNEAILWHAGEALSSRNKFIQLSKQERNQLLLFMKSL
jgi:CxxC motif-containing protein (DUF1111 family)